MTLTEFVNEILFRPAPTVVEIEGSELVKMISIGGLENNISENTLN